MTEIELQKQKALLEVFAALEAAIKANRSKTHGLGYRQRNAFINQIEFGDNQNESFSLLNKEWNESIVEGKVLGRIRNVFVKGSGMYGFHEKPEKVFAEIEEMLQDAIKHEEHDIAKTLNEWKEKLPK